MPMDHDVPDIAQQAINRALALIRLEMAVIDRQQASPDSAGSANSAELPPPG